MSLRETLKQIKADAVHRIPPEALEVMGETTRQLEASGQAERSVDVGERIPTFAVKNLASIVISSVDLMAKAPLVLLFYRGVW